MCRCTRSTRWCAAPVRCSSRAQGKPAGPGARAGGADAGATLDRVSGSHSGPRRDHCGRAGARHSGRVHDAGRAQVHRLHAAPSWPEPGGLQGAPAAVRRRSEAVAEGSRRSVKRQPLSVHHRAAARDYSGIRGVGRNAAVGRFRHRRYRRRPPVRAGPDLRRCLRRDTGGLGDQLEIRTARCDALGGADRCLRNCHGLCPWSAS